MRGGHARLAARSSTLFGDCGSVLRDGAHVRWRSAFSRLTFACDHLRALAEKYGWRLEAWAVLVNHYHFVAHSPANAPDAESLRPFLKHLHADLARYVNKLDNTPGRQVWQNYRETHLTFQHSYLARLNYTHTNAVHHGLVERAGDYEWCSAAAFKNSVTPAWVKTVASFKYDQIAEQDADLNCGDLSPIC